MRADAPQLTTADRAKRKPRGLEPRIARAGAFIAFCLAALAFLLVADFEAMDELTLIALGFAVFMPAVVIALGLLVAAATWSLGRETEALQGKVDELRQTLLQKDTDTSAMSPVAHSHLEALKARQQATETSLTMFFSQRARKDATAPLETEGQASLGLEALAQTESSAVPPADLIRALHFPENEADQQGFDSLRRALADPRLAPLIRAAQDVLTRLAQEGIYMDDLRPDRARPEFWRAFAEGRRGAEIAPLGGIRDRSSLAITSGRMRSDPEFRASVHLFLREFDRVFASFAADADDSQISAFADTRSARAFMLLGRVSGVFS